jgi:hypothetical protein
MPQNKEFMSIRCSAMHFKAGDFLQALLLRVKPLCVYGVLKQLVFVYT